VAELTELTFVGDWRITVSSRDAGWSQRVVVVNAASGTQILGGAPGNSMDVLGDGQNPWTLRIEHDDGSSGWQPNWLRSISSIAGLRLETSVSSEDNTSSSSDLDFNDLVIRLQKLGMAQQPVPPFAIRPETLQAMPEGIFEATLGRYFMAVRVTNIWTLPWPANARVGLSDRCRSWLAAGGVAVVDPWDPVDEASLGQRVIGGRVVVDALQPWASKLIYFKVDVSAATSRKHRVEIQVFDDASGAEDTALINPKASAPISVSRTIFDPVRGAFVSQCDVGVLTAQIKEMTVDLVTFKRAMANARKLVSAGGGASSPGQVGGGSTCDDPLVLERLRGQLRAFLDGKAVDLCAIYRQLACCCSGDRHPGPGGDGPWTGGKDLGLSFFVWPTVVDYTVDYQPVFSGQFGPIPFDDPWWKVLLIILAILLSLAAAASSVADLADRGDDVVIGILTRSVLNAPTTSPGSQPLSTDPGSIDAAVAKLNGHRTLTPTVFTLLDAQSGEFSTSAPIVALDGKVNLPGSILTNAQLDAIFQNLAANPTDPAAQDAVRVYKSGARSGIGHSLMTGVVPIYLRIDDGVSHFFLNQIGFTNDEDTSDAQGCHGDSGSLWVQQGTNAIVALLHAVSADDSGQSAGGSRIEDVMTQIGIRFA
jgi:hypothetical protein